MLARAVKLSQSRMRRKEDLRTLPMQYSNWSSLVTTERRVNTLFLKQCKCLVHCFEVVWLAVGV